MESSIPALRKICEKWRPYGLLAIWRDKEGNFIIQDENRLGAYYFGLVADIEAEMKCVCCFKDMPEDGSCLSLLWKSC